MEYSCYSFRHEPKSQIYIELLSYAIEICDRFLVVVRNRKLLNEAGEKAMQKLEPFLIKKEVASEWPGTTLYKHTAEVSTYSLNLRSMQTLQELSDGLFDWVHPNLPEDLCLIRKRNEVSWLITVSHEGMGCLYLAEKEYESLISKNPSFIDILIETG